MNKKQRESRRYSRKALARVNEIRQKYPAGISNIESIGDEARAWIEKKIQQLRECLKNVKFPAKPRWWETLRLTRNKTAHQTEDFTDKEFSDLCGNLFSSIKKIGDDLDENINLYKQKSKKKRTFEKFSSPSFGSEADCKQLVDAMEDMIAPVEPREVQIPFPKNDFSRIAEETLSEVIAYGNVRDYVLTHEGFCENIQTDILEWLERANTTLEQENPFIEEAVFIEQVKKLHAAKIAQDLASRKSKIQDQYKRLPSISESRRGTISASFLDFEFYAEEFSKQLKNIKNDEKKDRLEALRRNFIADMEKNFIERKAKWEQERIDALRKIFLDALYKKIQNFMRLEKLLSPFIKSLGRLWDLSEHQFETSGFEILDQFAKLLEQDESLQELAELLGKQDREQAGFEKELRDKIVIKTEWHPKAAYRGGINGIRYSNDIAAALPAEIAMLKNPAAKKLFQLKFAQKQLLSFDYQNVVAESKEETEQEEVSDRKKEPKGPVIICVDTSGSMHGMPENIAKTVTFALSKIAIEEERKCYLISFSTGIETLDLSDFTTGDSLSKLVQFLQMSFNGGTDASPALRHAIEMLQKDGYKNADVLMISDFIMGTIPDDLVETIEQEKEKHTEFYSLVIGSSGNPGAIDSFDHNWLYDISDAHAQRHLVEQLHEMR